MPSERFRPFATSLLTLGMVALVAACAALEAAIPAGRLTPTVDPQRVARAECEATLDHIPLVEVVSGEPTLAAAYAVSGPELDRYLSDQASRAGVDMESTGWASDRSDAVSMCLFDGDFLTNTPGPPGHDRSAVRVLVVVAHGKASLWSVAKEKAALPAKDPGVLAMTSSARSPSPVPSGTPMPEASCPPPPDHLLVAPVGAAWIGGFEGVIDPDDGRPPFAVWSIDEVLVGGPLGVDDMLSYEQPACDPVLTGGVGEPYLITTADPSSPTTDDTVVWRIDRGDRVTLMFPDLDTPPSVYAVETLEAARALVLSGAMPPGLVPSPSVPPTCPLDAAPRPSPDG